MPTHSSEETLAPTLGEIANVFRDMQSKGVTKESIVYALNRVYWEDPPATVAAS